MRMFRRRTYIACALDFRYRPCNTIILRISQRTKLLVSLFNSSARCLVFFFFFWRHPVAAICISDQLMQFLSEMTQRQCCTSFTVFVAPYLQQFLFLKPRASNLSSARSNKSYYIALAFKHATSSPASRDFLPPKCASVLRNRVLTSTGRPTET